MGKSTIFNALTGGSQHVGNWPGKTVERKEGVCPRPGLVLRCVDLPGIYSLTSHSLEEVVARDYILQERPEVVLVVLDASSIERSCYLLAQVLELTDRVVVALNMMDLAAARGYRISPGKLSQALGVPVVGLVARKGEGIPELVAAVEALATGAIAPHPAPIHYLQAEPILEELTGLLAPQELAGYPARWVALKLLEGDREIARLASDRLPAELHRQVLSLLRQHEHEPAVVADARYRWIETMLAAGMERPARSVITFTDRLDHLATHRYLGLPLLLAVFLGVFAVTFGVTAPISGIIDRGVAWLSGWVAGLGGGWVGSLVAGGIIPGVGGVLTFLPVVLAFFFLLGVLEETGYMARAAFVMDGVMHALGLHGKAFLSLLVGYGCNVPGVMAARILDNERDRVLVILVNSLIPCPARVGVAAFLVGAFFAPRVQVAVMGGLYLLSLAMVVLAGFVLRRVALPGEQAPLMMELPLYRVPSLGGLLRATRWRLWAFLRKAGTVILAATVVIWLLFSFPVGAPPEHTYLGQVGMALEPLGRLVGLDGRMIVALISGIGSKETSLATLGVLYHAQGQGLAQALRQQVSPLAALVFVVVQLLYVPCLATIATIRSETRSWKWTAVAVTYPLLLATGLGALIFWVGRGLGLG